METLNRIGLDTEQAAKLGKELNHLLAEYSVFYMNVRGYHWNIKGDDFFTLHLKFEELYTDLQLKVDEIAERILTLGATPTHAYSIYLEQSAVGERQHITDGKEAIGQILESLNLIIIKQREILALAGDAGDEGTVDLMSGYIAMQEKMAWMYSSYLGK